MTDEHVTLRPATEDDLSVLDRFLTDREVASGFQWFGWWDLGRWRREWAENGLLGDDRGTLMVVRDDEVLGFVGFRKVWASRFSFHWNMGIALLPEARGKGVGTEAQRQLVRYLFAHTVAKRVEADTEVENIAEQRSLEKAGFSREGIMRSVVFRDGRWRDGVRYSILRGEAADAARR
ncbi:GNAT family N-acetyltransferase [Streptomyces colonosanans]|uniref:N-acetyltransferase n=1 Tax=Streptomyces colonosanans TaxID=1428652 RepID=A0A1S2PY71_9ACTN|nr:GNAT family protein [Streptomyces colonosanans]OIJ98400.1 N-acetyltransferase [Streptomyces colonosanans]